MSPPKSPFWRSPRASPRGPRGRRRSAGSNRDGPRRPPVAAPPPGRGPRPRTTADGRSCRRPSTTSRIGRGGSARGCPCGAPRGCRRGRRGAPSRADRFGASAEAAAGEADPAGRRSTRFSPCAKRRSRTSLRTRPKQFDKSTGPGESGGVAKEVRPCRRSSASSVTRCDG